MTINVNNIPINLIILKDEKYFKLFQNNIKKKKRKYLFNKIYPKLIHQIHSGCRDTIM